jgi:hypothetical protein
MEIFESCQTINTFLQSNNEKEARNELIKLLDYHEENKIPYSNLVNHLIRETGLFPYLDIETSNWEDRFVYEIFKVNTGEDNPLTLHREQSSLLKKLIDGKSIAVSAPTSFGKSFVIDAFIAIKEPKNIVIIVPTIALTDETRRRLFKKFAHTYKIITTPEVELGEKNIFIFPQERAISYIGKIEVIDILVIDEFYKAGVAFDKDRAPILLKAILELGKKAKQRYYLAPNISNLNESPFTDGMDFIPLDFNTVFSLITECYKEKDSQSPDFKQKKLIEILSKKRTKTLIYAGTFTNIDAITNVLNANLNNVEHKRLSDFSNWLKLNYHPQYILSDIVQKGVGIHNGQLHRSLSQIQIKLFEEEIGGLSNIVSTSSIIEGVNTSAENVIIWANKNGRPNLNDFTYKNIVGRGGRMFRHFIGKVFLFEKPPTQESTQLSLDFTDDLLNSLDAEKYEGDLTREQLVKIVAFNDEMDSVLGTDTYKSLMKENAFQNVNSNNLKSIAIDMRNNPQKWNGLSYLNSENPNDWDSNLYQVLNYAGGVGTSHRDFVAFIKAISRNWQRDIPTILSGLRSNGVTIEKFFELERTASFKITSILNDINILQRHIFNKPCDISSFISKISHSFLPKFVYELEEYGLPRMLSRKIQNSGLINLENESNTIHGILEEFNMIGKENLIKSINNLHPFEQYIIDYFYDGIKMKNK